LPLGDFHELDNIVLAVLMLLGLGMSFGGAHGDNGVRPQKISCSTLSVRFPSDSANS